MSLQFFNRTKGRGEERSPYLGGRSRLLSTLHENQVVEEGKKEGGKKKKIGATS